MKDYSFGIKPKQTEYETIEYKESNKLIFTECGVTPNDKVYEMISQQLKNLSEEIRGVTKHLKETLDRIDEIDNRR